MPAHNPKLLDQVRQALHVKHYGIRTEEAYIHWTKRFILFHHKRHRREMNTPEIEAFLTHLAVHEQITAYRPPTNDHRRRMTTDDDRPSVTNYRQLTTDNWLLTAALGCPLIPMVTTLA
jgi:hypothetical protein